MQLVLWSIEQAYHASSCIFWVAASSVLSAADMSLSDVKKQAALSVSATHEAHMAHCNCAKQTCWIDAVNMLLPNGTSQVGTVVSKVHSLLGFSTLEALASSSKI